MTSLLSAYTDRAKKRLEVYQTDTELDSASPIHMKVDQSVGWKTVDVLDIVLLLVLTLPVQLNSMFPFTWGVIPPLDHPASRKLRYVHIHNREPPKRNTFGRITKFIMTSCCQNLRKTPRPPVVSVPLLEPRFVCCTKVNNKAHSQWQ